MSLKKKDFITVDDYDNIPDDFKPLGGNIEIKTSIYLEGSVEKIAKELSSFIHGDKSKPIK